MFNIRKICINKLEILCVCEICKAKWVMMLLGSRNYWEVFIYRFVFDLIRNFTNMYQLFSHEHRKSSIDSRRNVHDPKEKISSINWRLKLLHLWITRWKTNFIIKISRTNKANTIIMGTFFVIYQHNLLSAQ